MVIDVANLSDVDAICALAQGVEEFEVGDETIEFWPQEIVVTAIESPQAIVIVARGQDQIAGFAIASLNQAFRKATMENIYVAPMHRGNGIGGQLLDRVCSIAAVDHGCEYIAALVPIRSQSALLAYQHAGFMKGNTFIWVDKSYTDDFRR